MILIRHLHSGNHRFQPAIIWSLMYIAIACAGLYDYINWSSPVFLLGIVCLLQVSLPDKRGNTSWRFAGLSIAFGLLSFLLPVKTILYASVCTALLFVLESNYGKVKHAAVFTLLIMSPLFDYATHVFSFPVRLWLTGIAGSIMTYSGQQVVARGNMLMLNGNEFSVDPECMGLHMLQTSLLLGIMISSFYVRQYRLNVRILTLIVMLLMITALNILSNLFRIIALVQFNIAPGTVMHEVTGLCCLLVYVVIPGAFLIRMMIMNVEKKSVAEDMVRVQSGQPVPFTGLYLIVAVALAMAAFNNFRHTTEKNIPVLSPVLPGYTVQRIDADILKLNGTGSLVYIKNIHGFYSTEHNPMICWKGSGYTFQRVEKSRIDGQLVYTAVLTNGNEQLHTAWWYDNTKMRTISQISWRLDAFKGGADYALINVTCSGYSSLVRNVQQILQTGILNKAIGKGG